jgi:hypothetical protein
LIYRKSGPYPNNRGNFVYHYRAYGSIRAEGKREKGEVKREKGEGGKPGFMKVRAVTVFAKAGIGRKAGHKKRVFMQIFSKTGPEKKSLDRLRCFWQDYRCRSEKIMFFKSFSGKCQIKDK